MADDISTADMARLLLGMSATSPQGLTDPGMAVMSPLARKPDRGQIPYNTIVENGPTPMERFVGSLGQFKDQALDTVPMTAIPRFAARTYHAYEQGNTGEAGARALQLATLLAMPAAGAMRSAIGTTPGAAMMGLMGTQPGAKLSGEVALHNFRGGAQMPEHASHIAARSMPHPPEPPRGGMSSRDIVYEMDVNNLNRRASKRLGEGLQDMRAPMDAYERALMEQQARAAMRPFNVINGGN